MCLRRVLQGWGGQLAQGIGQNCGGHQEPSVKMDEEIKEQEGE
jgi:hypothetical protein